MNGLILAALANTMLAAPPAPADLADDAPYQAVLEEHLVAARVDYAALERDRADLDAYLTSVARVTKEAFESASEEAQVAYLINAYNAYTLASIIDHYPIKGGLFGGRNSIKGISGVWDERKHRTAIGEVTLDFVEHETLRKKYRMPTIHMGLVCASRSCPPLRAEPYRAAELAAQLEDQAKTYLASKHGLVVREETVYVSKIFKWFGEDFVAAGGWKSWVAARAPEAQRAAVKKALESGNYEWLEYDWTLNDRKSR